jgi:hypothetical protein
MWAKFPDALRQELAKSDLRMVDAMINLPKSDRVTDKKCRRFLLSPVHEISRGQVLSLNL